MNASEPQWRRRLRAYRQLDRVYRSAVALVGLVVVAVGLLLVPLPGPGWLVVLFGLVVWASEFSWASRLRDWLLARLSAWTRWVHSRGWPTKALLGSTTAAIALGMAYLALRVYGVPTLMPDAFEGMVRRLPGL